MVVHGTGKWLNLQIREHHELLLLDEDFNMSLLKEQPILHCNLDILKM